MNFGETEPKHILRWIKKRDNGDDTDYIKGKQDTQEAIGVFRSLYDKEYEDVLQLFNFLCDNLKLRVVGKKEEDISSKSLYRAFISLYYNDDIINIRLSRHFSTEHSLENAIDTKGKPDMEYHLVIDKEQTGSTENTISKDTTYNGVKIKVMDIDLNEFDNETIDEIILLLTHGTTKKPSTNISVDSGGNYVAANGDGVDYISESRLHNIIQESVMKYIISENQESKSIDAAKNLVMNELGYDRDKADEFVRIKIRKKFPILHYKKPAKFIYGITRMYLDGQLENRQIASKLYSAISYISTNEYYKQYDINLNKMSAEDFINDFYPSIKNDLNTDKENIKRLKITNQSNDYDIVKINSFEQAEKYSEYCDWCICQDEYDYDLAGQNGLWQLYFLLKKGFENIKGGDDEVYFDNDYMTPNLFDEYGMSMIAIYVDEEGRLVICKNRYNDDKLFDTSCILTTRQITELIGKDFYEVFKPKESNEFATDESISRYDRIISESIRETLYKLL